MITFLTLGFVNPQMQIPEGEKEESCWTKV